MAVTQEEFKDYIQTLNKIMDWLEQEPCEDTISRKSIKQKLQEHHDFFVNAYGGFSNLPQNDKSRVDEITNCIAMVVNEPPVIPQEPFINKPCVAGGVCEHDKQRVLDKLRAEIDEISADYTNVTDKELLYRDRVLGIIDKYKAEIEPQEKRG